MKSVEVPYKKSVKYPGKKTVGLTDEVDAMWKMLSDKKVDVCESVRPLIEDRVRALYKEVFGK